MADKKIILCIFLIVILFMLGCDSNDEDNVSGLGHVPMNNLDIDDDFDFQSTQNVTVSIGVYLRNGDPIEGITFEVFNKNPDNGGSRITAGITSESGMFYSDIIMPSYYDSIYVVGFMSTLQLPIVNGSVSYIFGSYDPDLPTAVFKPDTKRDGFVYLDPYDDDGVPDSLEIDNLSEDFLERVNTSLPERKPVPEYHPDYLNPTAVNNIIIDETCDVWITFVHEGASLKNSIGFYTYNQEDGAPESTDNLVHYIVFPNASLDRSGGELQPGYKVYLGNFDAGRVIGWFLVRNGWTNGTVSETRQRWYSDPQLNYAENEETMQHMVLLYDAQEEKLLYGVEDMFRNQGANNDFNDAVFYVTSNPVDAIDTQLVNPVDQPGDQDNDDISDIYDDYPTDPDRAFDHFYPAENQYGTLAFEDLWPQQGDYDLNDLVVDYNFRNVHNSEIQLIEIEGLIQLRAVGGSNQNGFAIEFPFPISNVESWQGFWGSEAYPMNLYDAAGKSVLRVIENTNNIIPSPGSGVYVNTQPDEQYLGTEELRFVITFNSPLDMSSFEYQAPFNPFIIVNQNQGLEVHLPDYSPTSFADLAYFQTGDDDSDADIGRFYKTANNLPWAINIPEHWNYPVERKEITWGYLAFPNWSESNGITYDDWYKMIEEQIDVDYIYIIR